MTNGDRDILSTPPAIIRSPSPARLSGRSAPQTAGWPSPGCRRQPPAPDLRRYAEGGRQIPAIAISTDDSDLLNKLLKRQSITIYMESHSKMVEMERLSYNVVAEIKGRMYPDSIILVGGHLDSWDVGGGAHDDGRLRDAVYPACLRRCLGPDREFHLSEFRSHQLHGGAGIPERLLSAGARSVSCGLRLPFHYHLHVQDS